MAVLPKRCARCGLTLHPTKTAGIACRKPATHQGADRGNGPCTLLGRTHAWTKARRGGRGDATQDSQHPAASHQEVARAMGPPQAARPAAIPVPEALLAAPRALPVLRYAGELPPAGGGAAFCGAGVAVLVASASSSERATVGYVREAQADLYPPSTQDRPPHLTGHAGQHRAAPESCRNSGYRGTGCVHCARTGL